MGSSFWSIRSHNAFCLRGEDTKILKYFELTTIFHQGKKLCCVERYFWIFWWVTLPNVVKQFLQVAICLLRNVMASL